MLSNFRQRFAALSVLDKTVLVLGTLVVIGMMVFLSPLVALLALLVLLVAIFALVIRLLRHRPLRSWGIIAATSFVVLLVFGGIANAVFFGGQPEQANSPAPQKQTAKPVPQQKPLKKAEKHKGVEQLDQKQQEPEQANAQNDAQPDGAGSYNTEETNPSATVTITRVKDGDTVVISPRVDGKDTVRLIGIDTPEEAKPGCGPQPLAQEATGYAESWVGRKVRLEFDQDRTDNWERLLAYVYDPTINEMMNVNMVKSGYAQVYIVPPNTKHEDELRKAQADVKSVSIGLGGIDIWSLPPDKEVQLADHDNGIGKGDGSCPPKARKTAVSPSASSSASPNPKPKPKPKQKLKPPPNRNYSSPNPNAPSQSVPGTAPSTASPSAASPPAGAAPPAYCDPPAHPVVPGTDGDGDGDGCAGED